MSNSKKYWKGIEELQETPEFLKLKQNEFAEELPVDQFLGNDATVGTQTNRRDFLKVLGFSVTAASLAACEAPVRKAIPYLNKPEEITPGVANYYATSYWDGQDYASVVIKTREARPIKVDGNELCSITGGGTNARMQASVLSLYDANRLRAPRKDGKDTEWSTLDTEVKAKLEAIAARGGAIRILSSTLVSPSLKAAIGEFSTKYPTTQWISYDAVSQKAIADAHLASHGKAMIPTYQFDKADMVIGIGCDFLSNWLSPVEYARQYASKRKVSKANPNMSRHIQIESLMTLTGSNADKRISMKPSQLGLAAITLYNKLTGAGLSGKATDKDAILAKVAGELAKNQGRALVVCGINDPHIQQVVNAINAHLGAYGNTINTNVADYTRQGNDTAVQGLVSEMSAGKVDALFVLGCNPVYSLPNGAAFKSALSKVDLSVSFSDIADETANACKLIAPDSHYLESWSDANPRSGHYSLGQPVINPLGKTRQALESLLSWAGNTTTAEAYISKYWETNVYPSSNAGLGGFQSFWVKTLHDGLVLKSESVAAASNETAPEATTAIKTVVPVVAEAAPVAAVSTDLGAAASAIVSKSNATGTELVVYEKTGMGWGQQSNNPWLQELPDPITKVTWDNYVLMNPSEMKAKGLNVLMGQEQLSDTVEVSAGGVKVTLPVVAQPGLPEGVIAIAFGYGRTGIGKTAEGIGANAFAFVGNKEGYFQYQVSGASYSASNGKYNIAATQTHHTMMGRQIVKEATLEEYRKDAKAGNEQILLATNSSVVGKDGKATPKELDLWQNFEYKNHFWNMAIDLNSCIGCGSCVVSCTAENNVPVVGKDEVRRSREMHWMRIDRYYTSDMTEEKAEKDEIGAIDKFLAMEVPATTDDTLEVVFQPVMCQHCNQAPCETVCPVLATTHSLEGLNQMTYNRCIGTRYCANNCPYKVRRFNWFRYNENEKFDFNMFDDMGKMVLNPDVTVRSRGVMEKCSMCVQRVQAGKLAAKKHGERPKDGSIKTACQQACPTNAITFGDYNDEQSAIRKAWNDERRYQLLEEVGTQPSVYYLTKIRNKNTSNA